MARIFVVDDEPSIRSALARIVAMDGHDVEEFEHGRGALDAVEDEPPDLIVTDIFMPEMDGVELLIELDRIAPHVPVIAISGGGRGPHPPILEEAVQLGAAATVGKPFRAEQVRRVVERVLASSAVDAAAVAASRNAEASRPATLEAEIRAARVLVADDEEPARRALTRMLERSGYTQVRSAATGDEAMKMAASWQPDLLILDLHMPGSDGFAVLEFVRDAQTGPLVLPVLVLTGDFDPEVKQRAFAAGAMDFLVKPPSADETIARVRNLLSTRVLQRRLAQQNEDLEVRVGQRTREVEMAHWEVVDRLATVAEYRDDLTGAHQRRVGEMAALIGRRLDLEDRVVRRLRMAAPLHDIGKVAIPDSILHKPGPLDHEEWNVMRTHTTVGASMLAGGDFPLLRTAERIALTHHERWDGVGYPGGLKGEEIPLEGRITALADVIDCMTHSRPYRDALPVEEAIAEVERCAGSQFDPGIVPVVLAAWEDGELGRVLDAGAGGESVE